MAERPIAPSRWLAKKAARLAVSSLGAFASATGVRVLTYHRFGPSTRMPFTVTAEQFEREMRFLAESGRAVSLAQIEAHLDGRSTLPAGRVLVTIDDGDPSVRAIAHPILQSHGVPSVLFALSGRPEGFEVMSGRDLRELSDAGMTIGSHTRSHRSMAQASTSEAAREARDSKSWLEDEIGRPVTSFAYPFGTRRDISDDAAQVLEEAGYTTGFTSLHGAIEGPVRGRERLLLPRVKVESGDPARAFPALCNGAMDRWRIVDDGLSGLQRPQGPKG